MSSKIKPPIKIRAETPPTIHGQSFAVLAAALDFAAAAAFAALFAAVFEPCERIACSTLKPVCTSGVTCVAKFLTPESKSEKLQLEPLAAGVPV